MTRNPRIPHPHSSVEVRRAFQRMIETFPSDSIDHDATTNFVAAEHIDHSAVSIIAGAGLSGGGTLESDRTVALSHLGIQSLTDPGADRILFWDDSETKTDWLIVGTGLQVVGTTLSVLASGVDHGGLTGLGDDDHTQYLLEDGTRNLTGNLTLSAGVTIDGRELSTDGAKLDGIEVLADVTDATNVAAAGAAMSGGAFHSGFSDFVSNEHIDHTSITLTAGSGLAGGGDISAGRTFDLDINSLAVATIVAGDFVPFWDITATATNKKTTFANFEAALDHGGILGLAGDDHTQYILADGTRAFSGVVVGVDPTLESHLATRQYVDDSVHFIFEYFFNNTASNIGGIYYKMLDRHTGEPGSSLPTVDLETGDNQALVNFATDPNSPGVDVIESGVYTAHIHAEKTVGTKPVKIYCTFVRHEADIGEGITETLIGTSATSGYITSSEEVRLHTTIFADVQLALTDRVVVKFYANVEATGSKVTVVLHIEGTTSSHVAIPITTEVLDAIFLRQDGTEDLVGNMLVSNGITIDGRDLSVDGTKLDGIESAADVTDATNVAAAGAAMSGGAFHDGFSDSVANEHIDHTGVTLTAGSGIAGGGDISTGRTFDLDINSLSAATIAADDFIPFWDITATATNKKITFANFEGILAHGSLAGYVSNEHIDWTSASATLYTTGKIGIGRTPIDDCLAIQYAPVNDTLAFAVLALYYPKTTSTAGHAYRCLSFQTEPAVTAGQRNTAYVSAVRGAAFGTSTLDGILDAMHGLHISFGMVTGCTGEITLIRGLNIVPYYQAGTCTNFECIYIAPPSTGATISGHALAIYDASGLDWWLTGDSQKIRLGAVQGDMDLYSDGADAVIEADADIFLNAGGNVKFGTKTGTGDVAIDGYVTIKDSLGNTVKLATVT